MDDDSLLPSAFLGASCSSSMDQIGLLKGLRSPFSGQQLFLSVSRAASNGIHVVLLVCAFMAFVSCLVEFIPLASYASFALFAVSF